MVLNYSYILKKIKSVLSAAAYQIYKHTPYIIVTYVFRHIDYFHYKALSFYEHPFHTKSKLLGIMGNECYGNLWAIKNATGENFHPHCMIEHGLYFGEYVIRSECSLPCIDTIYTYSEYRKNAILKEFGGNLDKEIIPVGPYILYVDNFKSKKALKRLKMKFGKVLLVFPSHSFWGQTTEYDMEAFLNEIGDVARNYDTVLVSVYWLDIKLGRHKMYLNKGYRVVCSGTRSDRWFLRRQKDLFELSDFSMSNDIGTHIGYSIALGVPHYVYDQPVKLKETGEDTELDPIRAKEYKEIKSAFSSKKEEISDAQKKIVNYYWGLKL